MAQSSQKRRKWLTLKEKLGAIDDVKAGKPIDDVAKKFGISNSQVYKLYKNKNTLLNTAANGDGVPMSSKFTKDKAKYPAIDKAVFEWFCSVRKLRGAKKTTTRNASTDFSTCYVGS